jgi:hypothetical protein
MGVDPNYRARREAGLYDPDEDVRKSAEKALAKQTSQIKKLEAARVGEDAEDEDAE